MNYRTGPSLWISTIFRSLPSPLIEVCDSIRFLSGSRNSPFLFFHVPKAGGTSISKLLYDKNLPHVSAATIKKWLPSYFSSKPTFAVIRNPFIRAISAYNFVLGCGTSEVWVDYHPTYCKPSFLDPESFYTSILPHLIQNRVNPVFMPQSNFFTLKSRIIVDNVFMLEDPTALSLFLSSALDDPFIPTLNKSPFNSSPLTLSSSSFHSLVDLYSLDLEIYAKVLKSDLSNFLQEMHDMLVLQ